MAYLVIIFIGFLSLPDEQVVGDGGFLRREHAEEGMLAINVTAEHHQT